MPHGRGTRLIPSPRHLATATVLQETLFSSPGVREQMRAATVPPPWGIRDDPARGDSLAATAGPINADDMIHGQTKGENGKQVAR
ncbi:uncharacterized protein SPSK_02094 [Sporothrix schenckii 1099-18]|uniref:Uncharacterized protein n=1 Tax=Sporothrix schenckii 1099-18 TaxID=1397361 RepID=A0A0F2MDF7_SPOSC|nr:uncharacterized protein SPSK_02094 [Sporothrix schenckii 1099-18]KJR86890.1 hypothetical protein SPSK_02094 [Sporothrix schenckii 1099-18]